MKSQEENERSSERFFDDINDSPDDKMPAADQDIGVGAETKSADDDNERQRAAVNFIAFGVFSLLGAVAHFSSGRVSAGIFTHFSSFFSYFLFEIAEVADTGIFRHNLAVVYEIAALCTIGIIVLPGIASFRHRSALKICAVITYADSAFLGLFLALNFDRLLSIGLIPLLLFAAFHLWLCYFMVIGLRAIKKKDVNDAELRQIND